MEKFKVTGGKAEQLWQVQLLNNTDPHQLAVDNYPGPNHGDVYVAGNGNHRVYVFNESGIAEEGGSNIDPGTSTVNPVGIAVDAAGDVFVSYRGGGYKEEVGAVLEFNSKWEPINPSGKS